MTSMNYEESTVKIDDVIIEELRGLRDKCVAELKDPKFRFLISWLAEVKEDNVSLFQLKLWLNSSVKPLIMLKDMVLRVILLKSGCSKLDLKDFTPEFQDAIYDKFKLLCSLI
jgi:ketopantoate reductase